MKYVFYIHSQITLLVSQLIIEKEEIDSSEVIILHNRGVQFTKPGISNHHFPYADPSTVPQTRNLIKCLQIVSKFDSFLNSITKGDDFKCYVPQNTIRGLELLISSKKCQSFSIMEEGLASYYKWEDINKEYGSNIRSFWDKIGYKERIGKKYFYRPDYEFVYGITEEAFPGYRNKILLSVNKLLKYTDHKYDDQTILIFDDIILSEILTQSNVLKHIERFLKDYNNCDKIYYKFHPMHKAEERIKMQRVMKEHFTMELIEFPNDFSIEALAASSKNLTFMVNLSSLGLYASFFGHRVFSYATILKDFEVSAELLYGKKKNYGQFISEMPAIFHSHVTFIKNAIV